MGIWVSFCISFQVSSYNYIIVLVLFLHIVVVLALNTTEARKVNIIKAWSKT